MRIQELDYNPAKRSHIGTDEQHLRRLRPKCFTERFELLAPNPPTASSRRAQAS
jgi:hypothetical protein